MQQRRPVRRALLSVSDKAGIIEFAQALSARGVELLSTGGTARLLAEKGHKGNVLPAFQPLQTQMNRVL